MIFGRAHPVFSRMDELVDVDFPRHLLFRCCFLLLLEFGNFWLHSYLTFRLLLLMVQKSGAVCAPVEIGGKKLYFSDVTRHFLVKAGLGLIFLKDYDLTF